MQKKVPSGSLHGGGCSPPPQLEGTERLYHSIYQVIYHLVAAHLPSSRGRKVEAIDAGFEGLAELQPTSPARGDGKHRKASQTSSRVSLQPTSPARGDGKIHLQAV